MRVRSSGSTKVPLRVEAVYAGVGDEERVGVPEREQVLADGLVDLILAEARVLPGLVAV
jgi:hypothetical protein